MRDPRFATLLILVVVFSACGPLETDEVVEREEAETAPASDPIRPIRPIRPIPGIPHADAPPPLLVGAGKIDDAVLVASESALDPSLPRLTVTMVDVGQGDGLLIQFPGGKTLALDGGPSSRKFSDYLSSHSITKIDYAVLTHAHTDHYTGLTPALGLLPGDCTTRVYDPGLDRSDLSGYRDFRSAAGCRYAAVTAGSTLAIDPDVEVEVLSAHNKRYGSSDDSHGVNNTSVVLRLRYGRFSMLFEGDAEKQAEQNTYGTEEPLLHSTVLKAGHHGSCTATATSYLTAIAPQYVLISAGKGNSYGLPNCQTIGKLKARSGLRWSRTDENGSIVVTTDGASYAVTRSRGAENVDTCPRDCASPLDF